MDKGRKEWKGVPDFRSENGWFTSTWGRTEQACQANSGSVTQKQWDTGATSYLPHSIQIRLRQHAKISFLKQVSLNFLGRKGGRVKSSFWGVILNKQLKIKSSFRVTEFWFPLLSGGCVPQDQCCQFFLLPQDSDIVWYDIVFISNFDFSCKFFCIHFDF